jgi:hypothetical protein
MIIAVWDTYVQRSNGSTMHFDILVPNTVKDEQKIYEYGKKYLKSKSFATGEFNSKECNFCHVEEAKERIVRDIEKNAYSILELENCT